MMNRDRGSRPGGFRDAPPAPRPALSEADARKIIREGDVTLLIDRAAELGNALAGVRLKKSQMRNFFGELRRLELQSSGEGFAQSQTLRAVRLLKPKLAYLASRRDISGGSELEAVLVPAIDQVRDAPPGEPPLADFKRLIEFAEALLAYHASNNAPE